MYRPLAFRLIVVAAGTLLLVQPVPFLRAPVTLITIGYLPGLLVASRTGSTRLGTLALAITLSPVLIGGATLALLFAGVAPQTAPWIPLGIVALAYVVAGARVPDADASEGRLIRATLIVTAVAALIAFLLPLTDTWWRVRSDSWYHAAIMNKLGRSGVPMDDPYFAGLRLQYMYFYHVVLWAFATVCRSGPFYAMIALNAIALAGLSLAFVRLASFFSRNHVPRVLALVLCLFGMNGLFYLFLPIRLAQALLGETRGLDQLRGVFQFSPAGVDTAIRFLSVQGNQFLFLEKFMLGTAFTLSLALMCMAIVLLSLAKERQMRRWHALTYVLVVTGMTMLHLVVGVAFFIATMVGLVVTILFKRLRAGVPGDIHLIMYTLLSALITVPYIYSVLPPSEDHDRGVALQLPHIIGLFAAVLPALLWLPLTFVQRHSDFMWQLASLRFLCVWVLVAGAVGILIDLPTNNETKFAFVLFIPMCALTVRGIDMICRSRGGKTVALTIVAATVVPANAIFLYHAVLDPSAFETSADELAAYEWIRTDTPKDALFLDDADVVRVPVLADRDQYWGNEVYAHNWGYDAAEMARRRTVRNDMYAGDATGAAMLPELYVFCRLRETGGRTAALALRESEAEVLFQRDQIEIFRVTGAEE